MNNRNTLITNIQRYSLNDGPGMRTTIFLKGCPLSCTWCHNPETQEFKPDIYFKAEKCQNCGVCEKVCSEKAIDLMTAGERIIRDKCNLCMECVAHCPSRALEQIGFPVDETELIKEISSDAIFYQNSGGGVTISGGEPLSHPEFVLKLLKRIKGMGIKTCIDTAGYAEWDVIEPMISYVDLFLYDIKCMDEKLHKKYTGVSNKNILRNFVRLVESGAKVRVRIPIIPGFNFYVREIEKTADFIQNYPIQGVDILPYHRFGQVKYRMLNKCYELKDIADLQKDDARPYEGIFKLRNLTTTIGG